ncbi:hypothetical protein OG948_00990 [Embleya sp. NBC_00888]|uniref:hypothetical protein n=1 Tax=Embleya sp. NBC_00888 TaxID=2975960 RepID=UPI00386C221A|nr:hypothetical protein OG948_00990 [Embleya sp. NBC_00888]
MGVLAHGADAASLVVVFRAADPVCHSALVDRFAGRVEAGLRADEPMPAELADAVLASGEVRLWEALAGNTHTSLAVRLALARLGEPEVSALLYSRAGRAGDAEADAVRAAVLDAADASDRRWYRPACLVEELLSDGPDNRLPDDWPIAALRAPFPEVLARTLLALGPDLPPAVLLEGCRRLRRVGDDVVAEFAVAAAERDALGHPKLAGRWGDAAEAAASPTALDRLLPGVRRAAGEWERRPADAARVRVDRLGHGYAGRAVAAFAELPEVDWELVRGEHARRPFVGPALSALTVRADCPDDLYAAAVREDPYTVFDVSPRVPPLEVFTASEVDPVGGEWADGLAKGLRAGALDPVRVLAEAAPAHVVFECLPTDVPAVRAALAGLAARLGASPAAWTALCRGHGNTRGTPVDLVASVLASTGEPAPPRAAVPAATAPAPGDFAFLVLFAHAAPDVRDALVAILDPRAAQQLLMPSAADTGLRRRIRDTHGKTAALGQAALVEQPADAVAELLDLDDPDVNAALFRYGPITGAQRARVLAGVDRAGRAGAVPVAEDVLADLRRYEVGGRDERFRLAALSGQPRVLRETIRQGIPRTEVGRLRALVVLWERAGRDEVATLIAETDLRTLRGSWGTPVPGGADTVARQALAAPDGPALLRAWITGPTARDRMIAALRSEDAPAEVLEEWDPLPWDALIAAEHEQAFDPLPTHALMGALRHPDCPRELSVAGLRRGTRIEDGGGWPEAHLRDGRLTVRDVVDECRFVPYTLRLFARFEVDHPVTAELGALLRARLGRSVDAWAVAVHLAPEFHGTLGELLDVAAASVAGG